MGMRERTALITTAIILTMMLLLHVGTVYPQEAKPDMRFAFDVNPPLVLSAVHA